MKIIQVGIAAKIDQEVSIVQSGFRPKMLDGKSIEQTDKMVYLGEPLTADGRCEKEVKRKIALAKSAFTKC